MIDLLPAWLGFAIVMALGQFSPGPDMVLLTRTALVHGRKTGCWTALGISCGLAMHAAVAVTGISTLFSRGDTWALTGLRWLGAGYLLWLGAQLFRSGLKPGVFAIEIARSATETALVSWRRGLLCNLLNPKVALFLAGVSAPFLAMPAERAVVWPFVLWLTIVVEGLVLWCGWVFLLQVPQLRERYLAAAHWFDLLFGLVLLGLALLLLIGVAKC